MSRPDPAVSQLTESTTGAAVIINRIAGRASDAAISERLHTLSHQQAVEYVRITTGETLRRRLRVRSDRGTECLIALPREQKLFDGAVLLLEAGRAIVIRLSEQKWLSLRPADMSSAVELGYFAGNLHWRVRFDGPVLKVALEGPEKDYLARLQPLLEKRRVKPVTAD